MTSILTGSRAFFDGMEGFCPHDTDFVIIEEAGDVPYLFKNYTVDREKHICYFHIVRNSKDKMIRWMVKHAVPMSLCMFLVEGFCKEFGITVGDLVALHPLRARLDRKHEYLGYIYDCYVDNGKMELTAAQRSNAFNLYKQERKHL